MLSGPYYYDEDVSKFVKFLKAGVTKYNVKMKKDKNEILKAFGDLLDVVEELRQKCSWDRKQTNESAMQYDRRSL